MISSLPGKALRTLIDIASLPDNALRTLVDITMSTNVLKALPCKLDIKRPSLSILYLTLAAVRSKAVVLLFFIHCLLLLSFAAQFCVGFLLYARFLVSFLVWQPSS